jgi:LPS sulfotransferase NodH
LICPKPFVVLAHGRSGSSILTNNIHTHSRAICHGELFHDLEAERWRVNGRYCLIDEDAYRFCADVAFAPPEPGVTHVGFKLFPHHAHQNDMQLGVWRFLRERPEVRIIHLERWNLLDAFVSHARSERSGVWYLSEGTTQDQRASHEEPITVDSVAFFEYARDVIVGMHWAKEYLRLYSRRSLSVRYEDMERDFTAVVNRIYEFLDLPPEPISYAFEKLNRIPHRDGVANYDALKQHFAYSFFRDYFE